MSDNKINPKEYVRQKQVYLKELHYNQAMKISRDLFGEENLSAVFRFLLQKYKREEGIKHDIDE